MKNTAKNFEPLQVVSLEEVVEYWNTIKELIDTAGKYASATKLRANLLNENNAWKVEHVFNKYYEDKLSKLDDRIKSCREDFYKKVEEVNKLCEKFEMVKITKIDKLLNMLLDRKRRESYRGKMDRKLAKEKIVALQLFEPTKKK